MKCHFSGSCKQPLLDAFPITSNDSWDTMAPTQIHWMKVHCFYHWDTAAPFNTVSKKKVIIWSKKITWIITTFLNKQENSDSSKKLLQMYVKSSAWVWGTLSRLSLVSYCSCFDIVNGVTLITCDSVIWHCWLIVTKGFWTVKNWVLICWWLSFDWSFAHNRASFGTTITSIISCLLQQNPRLYRQTHWLLNKCCFTLITYLSDNQLVISTV